MHFRLRSATVGGHTGIRVDQAGWAVHHQRSVPPPLLTTLGFILGTVTVANSIIDSVFSC